MSPPMEHSSQLGFYLWMMLILACAYGLFGLEKVMEPKDKARAI